MAYERVLQEAGATLPRRDAVDRKVIRDINENKGGIINRKENTLGRPPLRKGTPFLDSDNDGMPNQWEATSRSYLTNSQMTIRTRMEMAIRTLREYLNNTNPLSSQNDTEMLIQGRTASLIQSFITEFAPKLQQNHPNPLASLVLR